MRYEKTKAYFEMRLAEKTHPPTTAQQKAFTVALEALEKQIPKKPKEIITSDNEYICTLCPICNARVDDDGRGYEQPYCMECGQAISWEE